jgi:preprotein translocase SecE subunit
MAVATKTAPETTSRNPVQQAAVTSFLGALYVLFCFGLVFGQLPILWGLLPIGNQFLSEALLFIVTLGVIAVLALLARRLEGPHPVPGFRAGIGVAVVGLFLTLLISLGIGNTAAREGGIAGLVITLVVAAVMIAGMVWLFLRPGFHRRVVRLEAQGWFHLSQFKGNQGVRVRRGTLVGLLVLIACGIYTMIIRGTLGRGDWVIDVPGTDYALYLMFNVSYTGPVIVLLVLCLVAWRVINWPVFADFLIATEAELNKVSWTTRKRLVQDTVVVLATVALMALFLFAVDILWIRILSWRPIQVLQVDLREERAKQNAPTEW